MLFEPTRDEVRRFFAEAWRKRLARELATPLELMAADIAALHPEYHALLAAGEDTLAKDYSPEGGAMNPFLHLSLHLAIEEQLSIDQPPGLRAAFEDILGRCRDRHAALHEVLECLGETIWRAQRQRQALDGQAYLDCVKRR